MQRVTFSFAHENFAHLWDGVADSREPVTMTRHGYEDMMLLSADDYRSLVETVYLLASPANAKRLLRSLEQAQQRQGQPETLEELTSALGFDANA